MKLYILLSTTALLILCVITSASSVEAAPHKNTIHQAPAPFRHTFGAYWTGVKVGKMIAEFDGSTLKTDITTHGLVKKVTKYFSNSKTTFSDKAGHLSASKFFTTSRLRKRTRDITISYNTKSGLILTELVTPPDKRPKRPAVSVNDKRLTVDPLTAALLARQTYITSLNAGISAFDFTLYDARRLSRLEFTIGAQETIRTDFLGQVDVTRVVMKRVPLSGYTANEKRRMKAGEEPIITIFMSHDGNHMPVKAIAEARLGSAILYLEQ